MTSLDHCDVTGNSMTSWDDIMMSIVYFWSCHDTIVNVIQSLNSKEMLMATDGRRLHYGDLHRSIICL